MNEVENVPGMDNRVLLSMSRICDAEESKEHYATSNPERQVMHNCTVWVELVGVSQAYTGRWKIGGSQGLAFGEEENGEC